MFSQQALDAYVQCVVRRNELYLELERVRQVLVDYEQRPCEDHAEQVARIRKVTQIFRALLLTKEARQKVVQHVGNDNRSNA